MPDLSCIAQAPSTTTMSTPTCGSSDSIPEDFDAIVSARSDFTSDAASEDVPKLPDATSTFEQDYPIQGGFTATTLLEMLTSDRSTWDNSLSELGKASEENNNVPSNESAFADVGTKYAHPPGLIQEPPCIITDDSLCIDGFDSKIIDSEAANPTPAAVVQISSWQTPDEVASDAFVNVVASGRHTWMEPPSAPILDVVFGVWMDSKGSRCEVQLDEDTTSSCTVKTSCSGIVRETSGLIRISQCRGKPPSRIIWGSAFVLELPIKDPDLLQWRSIRGGRDFTWTREHVETEALQGARRKHASISTESLPDSESCDPEREAQESMPMLNSRSRGGKSLSHKRVWRAVGDKPVTDGPSKPEKAGKTPSEVAAATSRRVKSHSGAWRVIEKAPHK